MALNLTKRVKVDYTETPHYEGSKSFLFEVDKGDLPYDVFGFDCVAVLKAVSPDSERGEWNAKLFRRRKASGEIVQPESGKPDFDVGAELHTALRTKGFDFREDGRVFLGDKAAEDFMPQVTGVVVQDANIAQRVSEEFERRGYLVERVYPV
ncbi:hypothetical protein KY340_03885 [Candidatus Woesearchaeota archaeon]|nr:hypothetical protein [Candidatus Woesearchaeota archaeon]